MRWRRRQYRACAARILRSIPWWKAWRVPRKGEEYIGDGVYVSFDGWHFWLRTLRRDAHHRVGLEPAVIAEFLGFVARTMDDSRVRPSMGRKDAAMSATREPTDGHH